MPGSTNERDAMNELERSLVSNSAAAPPAHILEGLPADLAHREIPGAPRTIYEELWHITFWQQVTLDWIDGVETPYPEHASEGFPDKQEIQWESWDALRERFAGAVADGNVAAAKSVGKLIAERAQRPRPRHRLVPPCGP